MWGIRDGKIAAIRAVLGGRQTMRGEGLVAAPGSSIYTQHGKKTPKYQFKARTG